VELSVPLNIINGKTLNYPGRPYPALAVGLRDVLVQTNLAAALQPAGRLTVKIDGLATVSSMRHAVSTVVNAYRPLKRGNADQSRMHCNWPGSRAGAAVRLLPVQHVVGGQRAAGQNTSLMRTLMQPTNITAAVWHQQFG
jgi:hypothetical protein